MENKYYHRSRICEKQFRAIIRLFSIDIEATIISKIRHCIALNGDEQSPFNEV